MGRYCFKVVCIFNMATSILSIFTWPIKWLIKDYFIRKDVHLFLICILRTPPQSQLQALKSKSGRQQQQHLELKWDKL